MARPTKPVDRKETKRSLGIIVVLALILAAAGLYACSWQGEGTSMPEVDAETLLPPEGAVPGGETPGSEGPTTDTSEPQAPTVDEPAAPAAPAN
ncbi:hypothetical protein [Halodurantibacterium flavum]|uniref:Uncharacterized protein n=1 Tax=Halodurantibacterium flavum TaxID=1382802 RepID=A0ABW4S5Q0_9RHOB